jgi:selenocysteine-specific elongation factor
LKHIVVGTAGHIDHGKSALVFALTGTDPDRLKEEKARGITIDLGFAYLRDGDSTIAFVDVPGHERFIRHMLAGAGGIDAVLLAVAADESVMPQTREHFEICRLLAVLRGIVVITKSDLVDDDMLDVVRADIAELVRGSALASAPVIPVSSRSGAGLDRLRDGLRDLVNAAAVRPADGAARLPIDRVFSMRGFGTVVTGTLVSGCIRADQELEVVPGERQVKVRGVQVHGAAVDRAEAGQRVALNVAGVEVRNLSRGQVLASPGSLKPTRTIDGWVDVLPSARALRHGARVRFHQGTVEVLARVSIVATPDPEGAVLSIGKGQGGYARIRLESESAVTRGDRFVLRSYSPAVTIGGGQIVDPAAPGGGVRLAATLDRFAALLAPIRDRAQASEADAHALFVTEAGAKGIAFDALTWRAGVAPGDVARATRVLVNDGRALAVGDRLVAPVWRTRLAERVLTALDAHHTAQPLSVGISREEVRERVLGNAAPALSELVIRELLDAGRIVGRERLALAGREIVLTAEESRVRDALEQALRAASLRPPDLPRLAEIAATAPAAVERILQLLVRQKVVVRLGGIPFHYEALERLKAEVRSLRDGTTATPAISVATFKDRYGLSRRHAIPLLEYLDRERVTRRVGDSRLVL